MKAPLHHEMTSTLTRAAAISDPRNGIQEDDDSNNTPLKDKAFIKGKLPKLIPSITQ